MDFEKVAINIEAIENLKEEIENQNLKEIVEIYEKRVHQIFGTLLSTIAIMNYGLKEYREVKLTLEAIYKTNNLGKEYTPKGKKEIDAYINDYQGQNARELLKESVERIKVIQAENPKMKDYLENHNLNSLVNFWTAFETTAKDAWKVSVNKNPMKYIQSIINREDLSDLEGFNNKSISLGLLAKYKFDISRNLGDLLSPKFDFTSIKGIKMSYQSLLKPKSNALSFLSNEHLNQLEISRHLIVHNAGVIDREYLKRSKKKEEVLGENIKYSTEEYFYMINESISATSKLIKTLDN